MNAKRYFVLVYPIAGTGSLLFTNSKAGMYSEKIGFVVSIYGKFGITEKAALEIGFKTKKQLFNYCQQNGMAVYLGP